MTKKIEMFVCTNKLLVEQPNIKFFISCMHWTTAEERRDDPVDLLPPFRVRETCNA
jgi:hypothetical protein